VCYKVYNPPKIPQINQEAAGPGPGPGEPGHQNKRNIARKRKKTSYKYINMLI
tara:strand:+ start:195 stop:353 length:159 start_codon:yes stop_codon:yes gene_type:complete